MQILKHGTWQRLAWLVCAVVLVTAALPATAQADGPQVRFAHLVPDGDPVDVYLDGQLAVDALRFTQASKYLPLPGGTAIATISLSGHAEADNLLSTPLSFAPGDDGYYTVALVMHADGLIAITLPADGVPLATGEATVGDLTISGAYVRATTASDPGTMGPMHGQSDHQGGTNNGGVTAAYLTIHNGGAVDDRLTAASADAAATVEIHETIIENDVARMQALPDGVPIPAGGSAELKPGGMHLMLMGLAEPLAPGQTVTFTLTFESGAVAVVRAPVRMP